MSIFELNEFQGRRAANIIWSFARDYSFSPDFKAFDGEGNAELYWNGIIGGARYHFDYSRIEDLFRAANDYEDADVYEGILWLVLENCVFLKELPERPVLNKLRLEYAISFTGQFTVKENIYNLFEQIAYAHYLRVLGREEELNSYERCLLDELELPADIDTDEFIIRARAILQKWYLITCDYRKQHNRTVERILKRFTLRKNDREKFRKFLMGFSEHSKNAHSFSSDNINDDNEISSKMSLNELRQFMQFKYGKSIYSDIETADMEKKICTDAHINCHLLFTRGEKSQGKIKNGFEALQKEIEKKQVQKNITFFEANIESYRVYISKLTAKIMNTMLVYLSSCDIRSDTGILNSSTAWRAKALDDNRVFSKVERGEVGNIGIDILLDASTSQKYRQEIVSSQGYIISQSLKNCNIPYRIMSFCSMTGFTIIKVFKDYYEHTSNKGIFEYVANGCNRDGLAIAAVRHLCSSSGFEHKILVIVSDAKPVDVVKTQFAGEFLRYENTAGITNTAVEVRKAKAEGISVICLFTGEDEDIPAAKTIYGQDFARVKDLSELTETFGKLLHNQIKNI